MVLGIAAFSLRLGVSLLTESHPLFPPYYYTDARLIDDVALKIYSSGITAYPFFGSPSQMLQARLQAYLYEITGPRPMAAKILNALLGTAALLLLFLAWRTTFDESVALVSAALVALWPSHIFYTSQNLKESPVAFFTYAALACGMSLLLNTRSLSRRVIFLNAVLLLGFLCTSFYRSYVLLTLATALALSFLFDSLFSRKKLALLGLATCLMALGSYQIVMNNFLLRWLYPTSNAAVTHKISQSTSTLIPHTIDEFQPYTLDRPTSPHGLSNFRKSRQFADRRWAKANQKREIATQLFPNANLDTWHDVLCFLPKGMFYVLFMPLPGLYPLEGKPGRIFASLENLILFILAALSIVRASQSFRDPRRLALILFFSAIAIGAALLEFDLGSASRHKLLYLPMLFPFAVEEIRRLIQCRRTA